MRFREQKTFRSACEAYSKPDFGFLSPICDQIARFPTYGKERFGGHEMPRLRHCFPKFLKEYWHGFCLCQWEKPRCWPFVYSDSSEARFLIDTS